MTTFDHPAPAPATGPDPTITHLSDERLVVGAAILAAPEVRAEILGSYQPSDLADPRCRFVDGLMRRMQVDGVPVDLNTIPQYARRHGDISDGPPRMNLASWLVDATCGLVPGSGTFYAAAVIDNSARRVVRAAALELIRVAGAAGLDDLQAVLTEQLSTALEAVARAAAAA